MGGEDTSQATRAIESDPPRSTRIVPLSPQHAEAAARLHVEGQPGTFLTSLGPNVLQVIYTSLSQSSVGFGYAAVAPDSAGGTDDLVGFVSAATSVGRLFANAGLRHGTRLFPVLLARFVRQPALIGRSIETGLYPFLARDDSAGADESPAELLSIMVEQEWRGRGVGAQLMETLVAHCAARRITHLDVTVDADNQGARRFYARHGFSHRKTFRIYGRSMCLYGRRL